MRFLIDEETATAIDRAIEHSGGRIDDAVIAESVQERALFARNVRLMREHDGRPRLELDTTLPTARAQTQLSLVMLKFREELVRHTPDPALL